MLNVGIIGSGFIVPAFLYAAGLTEGYHFRAISSPIEEQLIKLKNEWNIDYYTLSNEELLADPTIDAVYIAVPNGLHYKIAKQALEAGKHVILEKPFTHSYASAEELVKLAQSKNLILFEAITLYHLPNYQKIREQVKKIGDIKMVSLNFSKVSQRYKKFKEGIILPVFDPKQAGGALMDLNIYCIHFTVGLFGRPKAVQYYPNMNKGVDTSGVLILDYGTFKATLLSCKDANGQDYTVIFGDEGYIRSLENPASIQYVDYVPNEGEKETYCLNEHLEDGHYHEYKEFYRLFTENDYETVKRYNEHTLAVMDTLERALKSAGISFE